MEMGMEDKKKGCRMTTPDFFFEKNFD